MININLELNTPYTGKEFFMGVIGEKPAKNKNQKDRQKRIASERCSFYTIGEKRGMKYIITEIFSQQRIKLNGKYAEDMKTVLIYLLQNNNGRMTVPKSVLMTKCGFVNGKYLNGKKSMKKTSKQKEVLLSNTKIFFDNVEILQSQAIRRNMKYLVDASYVICNMKKRCRFTIKEILLDKNGNVVYKNGKADVIRRNDYMLMNEEQEEFISGVMRYVLNELGFETMQDVYTAGKSVKELFYNNVYDLVENRLVNDYTQNIIDSDNNWIHKNDRCVEVEFDYFYEVYDIRANEYIYDFKISEEDFKKAVNNINSISETSIIDSHKNCDTIQKKLNIIQELNTLFNEENNIDRYNWDMQILIKEFISR